MEAFSSFVLWGWNLLLGDTFRYLQILPWGKSLPTTHRGINLMKFSLSLRRCSRQWIMAHLETESWATELCSELLHWQL